MPRPTTLLRARTEAYLAAQTTRRASGRRERDRADRNEAIVRSGGGRVYFFLRFLDAAAFFFAAAARACLVCFVTVPFSSPIGMCCGHGAPDVKVLKTVGPSSPA